MKSQKSTREATVSYVNGCTYLIDEVKYSPRDLEEDCFKEILKSLPASMSLSWISIDFVFGHAHIIIYRSVFHKKQLDYYSSREVISADPNKYLSNEKSSNN